MTHLIRRLAVVALLVSPAAAAAQERVDPAAPGKRLRIAVAAVDGDGKPVGDLRPRELEVWVGIYQVPIETVTVVTPNSERGRTIVLVLDNLTVQATDSTRIREVARRFVTNMQPDDQMMVMGLNGDVMKSTADRAELFRRIDAYSPFTGGLLPFDRLGEHVFQTLTAISRHLVELPGRKTIVGIGSGWLFDTPVPPPSIGRDLRREWVATMRAMATADASLYVIDPGGLGRAPFATSGATGFARETGGHAFMNTNDVTGVADRIMRETGTYYVLEIADPPTGKNAELREVDVRVLRKGVTVRARRWIAGGKALAR